MTNVYHLSDNSTIEDLNNLINKNQLYLKYKNIKLHVLALQKTKTKIPLIFDNNFIYHFKEGFFLCINNNIFKLKINLKLEHKLHKLFNTKKIQNIQSFCETKKKSDLFLKNFKIFIRIFIKIFRIRSLILRISTYKFFDFIFTKSDIHSFLESVSLKNLNCIRRITLNKKIKHIDSNLVNLNSLNYFSVSKKTKLISKKIELIEFGKCFINSNYLVSDANNRYYYDEERWRHSYYFFDNPRLVLNRKLNQVSDLKDLIKNQNEIFLRNVINLYDPLIKNFSHFITDYLPLIIQIEKQKEYKNYSFLLPLNMHPNIIDYINIFTNKNRRFIFVDNKIKIKVENLVQPINFTSIKYHPLNYNDYLKDDYYTNHVNFSSIKQITLKMNTLLKSNKEFFNFASKNKIFILRKSKSRHTNNKYLRKIVNMFNFDEIQFNNINIFEQAHTFKYSSIIFGITGSEFANLIYSDNRSKVFIVVPSGNLHWIYKYWSALSISNNVIFLSDTDYDPNKNLKRGSTLSLGSEKLDFFKIYSNFIEINHKGIL